MTAWLDELRNGISRALSKLAGKEPSGGGTALPRRLRGGKTATALEALRLAALKDPEAARFYLRQRVLIADVAGVAEFYEQTVMPRYPDLVLDPANQGALVRMLEFGQHCREAIRAAELFLSRYPVEAGWDAVALSLGRLLLEESVPPSLADAIRHLVRVEAESPEKRHQAEARRLRDALLVTAEGLGLKIELSAEAPGGVSREQVVAAPPRGLDMPMVSGPKKRVIGGAGEKTEAEGSGGENAPLGAAPPAPEALSGRQPLPLKSVPGQIAGAKEASGNGESGTSGELPDSLPAEGLRPKRRAAALMPFLRNERPPDESGSSAYGVPPEPHGPGSRPSAADNVPVGEGAYGVEVRPEKPRAIPSKERIEEAARAALPDLPGRPMDKVVLPFSMEEEFYASSPIAGERPSRLFREGESRTSGQGQESGGKSGARYALLLEPQAEINPEAAQALASALLQGEENGRAVRGIRGLVLREGTRENAVALREAFSAQGIPVRIVAEDHPALRAKAVEITSLQIEEEAVTLASATARVRIPYPDLLLIQFARLRISARSRTQQAVLEILAGGGEDGEMAPEQVVAGYRRFVLWERTFAPAACRIHGEPPPGEDPLGAIFSALIRKIGPEKAPSSALSSHAEGVQAAAFRSFREYEDALACEILSRWGIEGARA